MPELRIARVFPRVTRATPRDALAFFGKPPLFVDADEVHVSVTFTWDLRIAEQLAKAWETTGLPVRIGGPATGQRSEEFVPGRYIKKGYVITSRGCPNKCWFCSAWRREGTIRELPVCDGWNVLDDNLLACSDEHVRKVFAMLMRQKERIQFTGGLEAKRLKQWHAEGLRELRPKQLFFAYDTPDDLEPLREAGKLMLQAGFTRASRSLRCYVLCGYPKDTMERAEKRMIEALDAGFTPMAMLWKEEDWVRFQKRWARPAIIHSGQKRRSKTR